MGNTICVAVKASSYSEAVFVSFMPVVPITTTPGVLTKILKTSLKKVGVKIEKLEFDLEKLEFLVLAEI